MSTSAVRILIIFFCLFIVMDLNSITEITLGNGAILTGQDEVSPVNLTYNSIRCQMIITKEELNSEGIYGPVALTEFGFNIYEAPVQALPNYKIRMADVTVDDAENHNTATLKTVFTSTAYSPIAGAFDTLQLTDSYIWQGYDNILVDVTFGFAGSTETAGRVYGSAIQNGFRYVGSTDFSQTYSTTTTVMNYRPDIKLGFQPYSANGWPALSQDSPFGSSNRYVGSASIYRNEDMGSYGTITHLGWNVMNSNNRSIPAKIYLKEVTTDYFNS
ncbi:MAG: hypothetical protein JXR56_01925, partial [Candidatus Cloacimonetes bacterium]|nr:hypothetical protein [Candidatus Cloacimonadota bacterium]